MTQTDPSGTDYAHCEDLLRRDDPDRWLAALFVPAQHRPHIHALYAFSLEIARIRTLVSEPMLGEIRLQWWREVLVGERRNEALAHPIAAAVLDTMARCNLPEEPFSALIGARLFDLYDEPMPALETLEAYAKATVSGLFLLAGRCLAEDGDGKLAAAADAAGIAYAVTGLLRALPWHQANGQVYVPADMLAAHDSSTAEVRIGKVSPGLVAALGDLRQIARDHLRRFDALTARWKSPAAPVFLPVRLCDAYLRQMEKPGYDPFRSRIEVAQWRRQWILWRAARAIG